MKRNLYFIVLAECVAVCMRNTYTQSFRIWSYMYSLTWNSEVFYSGKVISVTIATKHRFVTHVIKVNFMPFYIYLLKFGFQ